MKRWVMWTAFGVGALVLLVVAGVATEASSFCPTCHEMGPYYTAWQAGPHGEEADCVTCHVDPGLINHLAHKPVALLEVVSHFRGDITFPRPESPELPNARCTECHDDVIEPDNGEAFSHAEHAERAACKQCHASIGHEVTVAALKEAGIYDPVADAARTAAIGSDQVAAPGAGEANIAGHPSVGCSECHDLAATGCLSCHSLQIPEDHTERTDCEACHTGFADWAFSHPDSAVCTECHDAPTNEAHQSVADCTLCHKTSDSWAFNHPGANSTCGDCHTRPNDEHPENDNCGECHSVTGGWEDEDD